MDFYLINNTVLIDPVHLAVIVSYDIYDFLLQQYNLVIHGYAQLKIQFTCLVYNYVNFLIAVVKVI